ncbi:MAG: hypothetical protein Q4E43_07665 [Akkermansia sp.]|nr:hypothetical protein [Akkermansia sp.]
MKPTSHTILTLLAALCTAPALAEVPAWTGGDNPWSSSTWDGQSIPTSGEDVTFNAANPIVSVEGTVTPNSITFEQGTTLANGSDGAVATGTVTVNAGTVAVQVPLAAESAALAAGTTLQYTSATDCTLDTAFTGDASTTLGLYNSNNEGSVTYRLDSADMADFHGTVRVGDSEGTDRTVVVTQNISQDYMLGKTSELVLTGSGAEGFELIGGKVRYEGAKSDTDTVRKQDCLLTVAEGAKLRLDDGNGLMGVPKYMKVKVLGEVMFGSADTPLTDYNPVNMDVYGSATMYFGRTTKTLPSFSELTLHDNAVFDFRHAAGADYNRNFRPIITNLTVDGSAHLNLYGDVPSINGRNMYAEFIEVTNLAGAGDLNIGYTTANRLQKTVINYLGNKDVNYYKGDISITTHAPGQAVKDKATGAYFDMGGFVTIYRGGELDGALRVMSDGFVQDGVQYGLAGFFIGDRRVSNKPIPESEFVLSIHGIDDTGSTGKTFLASNGYNNLRGQYAIVDPNDRDAFEKGMYGDEFMQYDYTLVLTGNDDYSFGGTVYKKIAIVKNGEGTQTFSGDTSRIDKDIIVNSGGLLFEDALATKAEAPINVTFNGGTLKLSGGNIASLTGPAQDVGATLILGTGSHGEVNDIDITNYTGIFDVQLEDGHVLLRGGEIGSTFGNSLSSSGSSGIEVAEGMTLKLLEPINVNNGDLTMKGSFDVSEFELKTEQTTHRDTEGRGGRNGFVVTHVTIANLAENARTIDDGATLIHTGLAAGKTLRLGTDGQGVTDDGDIDHTEYLMVDDFTTASVSDIQAQGKEALQVITMENGTLTVDADTDKLKAIGGTIVLTNSAELQILDPGAVKDVHIQAVDGTIATEITNALDVAVEGKLNIAGALQLTDADDKKVDISARGEQAATLSGKVDVDAAAITGGAGSENTVENAEILTHSDFVIRDVALEGSFVDLAENTTGFLYNVEIRANSRITDDAAALYVEGTKAFLDEGSTEASDAAVLPEDVMLYRCGDTDNWVVAERGLTLVNLDSELISRVMITGNDLTLNLAGLTAAIGDADLVSVTFTDGAAYDVEALRMFATLDGTRLLEGFVETQTGTVPTVYFFTKHIPEPATGTLSLLALAALAARRRRK